MGNLPVFFFGLGNVTSEVQKVLSDRMRLQHGVAVTLVLRELAEGLWCPYTDRRLRYVRRNARSPTSTPYLHETNADLLV